MCGPKGSAPQRGGCLLRGGRTAAVRAHTGSSGRKRWLRTSCPKIALRVMHQVGIERVVVGDEHGERILATAPGPADALGKGRTGARPTGHDDRIQPGDVNAQLQRGGAGQAQQLAVAEPAFELAALFGVYPARYAATR